MRKITIRASRAGAIGAFGEDICREVLAVLRDEAVRLSDVLVPEDDPDEVSDGATSSGFPDNIKLRRSVDVSVVSCHLPNDFIFALGPL